MGWQSGKVFKEIKVKKILFISPHCDDSELGAGATISKMIHDGHEVHYLGLSICGNSFLEKECRSACQVLGVENIDIRNFTVRRFDTERQAILDLFVEIKKSLHPDIIFIPSLTDHHQDHYVVSKEALRAFKCTILGYQLPWNINHHVKNYFIHVSVDHLEKKVEALSKYSSQSNRAYMEPDYIWAASTVDGIIAGSKFAEAFEAIRIIW